MVEDQFGGAGVCLVAWPLAGHVGLSVLTEEGQRSQTDGPI